MYISHCVRSTRHTPPLVSHSSRLSLVTGAYQSTSSFTCTRCYVQLDRTSRGRIGQLATSSIRQRTIISPVNYLYQGSMKAREKSENICRIAKLTGVGKSTFCELRYYCGMMSHNTNTFANIPIKLNTVLCIINTLYGNTHSTKHTTYDGMLDINVLWFDGSFAVIKTINGQMSGTAEVV